MLKTIILSLFIASISFSQTPIKNFDELLSALKSGKDVKAVLHYNLCTLKTDSTEEKGPDAIGGMELKTYEYFAPGAIHNPNGFLTCSETILINHYKRGYVLNYVKLKISDDDSVVITARYLKPETYEVVMDETFIAKINDGSNSEGVYLFSN